MCLIVRRLPRTEQDFLIGDGIKRLLKKNDVFYTPYRFIQVPDNGWLLPEILVNSHHSPLHTLVEEGAIHYYSVYESAHAGRQYRCYAFGIIGYRNGYAASRYYNQDAAAAYGLYIRLPDHPPTTEDRILSMMHCSKAKEGISAEDLIQAFPELLPISALLKKGLIRRVE